MDLANNLGNLVSRVTSMAHRYRGGRLSPAEIFHEVLEHRWYMSEQAGRDVGTTAAAKAYFEQVLPAAPEPMEADDAPA